MSAVLLAAGFSFLWGIRRGASSCLALCVPAIIPALVEGDSGWKKGAMVALWFNLPRILLLALLGMVIGAGGFLVADSVGTLSAGGTLWGVGYLIVGVMMLAFGLYTFAVTTDRLEDISEGKECPAKAQHPLLSRLSRFAPKNRAGLLLWGFMVSIACVGETVIALESVMVGVVSAGAGTDPWSSALIGGFIFLLFGIGTAIPSILIGIFGSTLADREKRQARLLQVERAAALLMILFAGIIIWTAFGVL